ncbi:hypothetical protein G6514_000745 [Epicoccum nigrum]|nr:hypothetical protein G6514_000745 [Epicoccum nigrum]
MENQNLSRPFLIEFDGQFVVNPPLNAQEEHEGRVPARVGDRRDAAVFKLEDGLLRKADDGIGPMQFFGRFVAEPLAYIPMPVYWISSPDQVQRTVFIGDESSPQALECSGFPMGVLPDEEKLVRATPRGAFPVSRMKLHWLGL